MSKYKYLLALLCISSWQVQAENIKIAVVGPKTGPVANLGAKAFEAVNAANAAHKGKNTYEIVEFDDACEPKQAVSVANKIAGEGIMFVVGHLCSDSTIPAADIYRDEGILMITPTATSPKLTQDPSVFIKRTMGLDSTQGVTAANYIANHTKAKRIAVIHDKKQYGEGIASVVRDTLKADKKNVVIYEGITSGEKDFSALISKFKKNKIDFVYYGGYHTELGLILKQAKEAGLNLPFMGPEGVGNTEITNIARDAVNNLIVTLPQKYDALPENAATVKILKEAKADPTHPFTWTAYAAYQSIVDGIEKTGSDDSEKVAQYLSDNQVDTVIGKLKWTKTGDLADFEFGVYQWNQDGTGTPIQTR